MKPLFLTAALVILGTLAYGQSTPSLAEDIKKQKANPYFIQVAESNNPKEFFPKLYPIGFILKDTKEQKTTYLLGDFETEIEAKDALASVRASGYTDAFIVNINR